LSTVLAAALYPWKSGRRSGAAFGPGDASTRRVYCTPSQTDRRANAHPSPDDLATTGDINRFIEQLPRSLGEVAHINLVQGDDSGLWQITVTLAPADQATLDALHPSVSQLCASAQHALDLAAIGSQIDPAHSTVAVQDDSGQRIAFVGEAALWWVANVPTPTLSTCIAQGFERMLVKK
jgi:hypothetical protein